MRDRLYWFDKPESTDPAIVKSLRPTDGPRPDIMVQLGNDGWFSLESRGRTAKPPKTKLPNAGERKRLVELDQWAVNTSISPKPGWAVAWSWIGDSRTVVDFFDPGDPVEAGDEFNIMAESYVTDSLGSLRHAVSNESDTESVLFRIQDVAFSGAYMKMSEAEDDEVRLFGLIWSEEADARSVGLDSPSFSIDTSLGLVELLWFRNLVVFTIEGMNVDFDHVERLLSLSLDAQIASSQGDGTGSPDAD